MSKPLYKTIYYDIKNSILDETYPIGVQLPTDVEFTKKYGVSSITIKKAMDLLKEDNLISRKPRKGTIVTKNTINATDFSLKSNKLPIIGFILTDFNDVFGTDILRSFIMNSLNKSQVIFKISNADPQTESHILEEFIELGVDGIVLLPASSEYISPKLLELVSKGFPLVLIDRKMDNLPTCSVQTDNFYASLCLTEHLFENGHKKIGIVTARTNISTTQERIDGAISAHVKNHIPINQDQILSNLESMVPNSNVSPQEDVDRIKEFLNTKNDLTAIFTGEYTIALQVKQAIEEMGNDVYRDCSVVCFDHPKNDGLDKHKFVFTHVLQNQEFIGKKALDLILKKIKEPELIDKINAPFELVQGMSVKSIK